LRIVEKKVAEEHTTRVAVGRGLLRAMDKLVNAVRPSPSRALVVHDDRVPWDRVGEVVDALRRTGLETYVWGVAGGEHVKSLETVISMWGCW
jgi:3-dehydroquinate synthetase